MLVSFVVNLVKAFRVRGSLAPKPSGGRRHAKLEPHRAFLLEKVAEKADITMPELAAELAAATCERWLIRIGYRFKKRMARPVCWDAAEPLAAYRRATLCARLNPRKTISRSQMQR